jgi:hypothetical protein
MGLVVFDVVSFVARLLCWNLRNVVWLQKTYFHVTDKVLGTAPNCYWFIG